MTAPFVEVVAGIYQSIVDEADTNGRRGILDSYKITTVLVTHFQPACTRRATQVYNDVIKGFRDESTCLCVIKENRCIDQAKEADCPEPDTNEDLQVLVYTKHGTRSSRVADVEHPFRVLVLAKQTGWLLSSSLHFGSCGKTAMDVVRGGEMLGVTVCCHFPTFSRIRGGNYSLNTHGVRAMGRCTSPLSWFHRERAVSSRGSGLLQCEGDK
eukprot:GHVU01206880.1.p1 GENE.GHVU01206880.1~~GHVU01206880.1.p1  ORF type:complete len:212 (+),score=10.83 GHVU01206880.1:880-1515(+)